MKKSKVKKIAHEDSSSKQTTPVSSLNQTKYKRLLLVLVIATFAVFGAFLFFMTFVDGNGPIPKDIQITNITGTSATVVWTTDEKAYGVIAYSESNKWSPFVNSKKYNFAYDDRDIYASEDNKLHRYYTHHVTLNNLDPSKTYSYRIVYGQNPVSNTTYPSLTTGADLDIASTPIVLQGAAIANFAYGNLSKDAFVTVTVKDFETNTESSVLSGVVDDSGRFSLDLRGARSIDNSKVFEEIDPYDKISLLVEGGVVQGEGSITSIVANASSLPTILMLTKNDVATRKLVSSAYAMNDRTGDVLGESTCSDCKPCPSGYGAQDSQYCTCWRLSDDQSIEQTKNPGCNDSSQNETDQNNPEDPTSTTGPSVEEVTRDGTGKYCQGNSLCTCSVVNGEVVCDQCSDCGDNQTCNNNSAGKAAFCQDNEEDGSSTPPATGSGSKSTSTQPYQTSGQEPTVGEAECIEGSVWYKSGEKSCDATNKWTVTISGKEIEYYPQVWRETVYQCVKKTDGGTEWISFTKSGRLTGEACQGDEKNIEGLSEAEKKKIEDLKNSADVKEASQTFASTCNAGSYDYTEEKDGKACTVHVVQGADCSWSLQSEDCGYSLTSQDVDPGSGGAESKPDPAVATKIANMMTEKQCADISAFWINRGGGRKAENFKFISHPDYPGLGYCSYTTIDAKDACNPLVSDSCPEGKVCRYSDADEEHHIGWTCGDLDNKSCNPFVADKDQCEGSASVCLISSYIIGLDSSVGYSGSICSEINVAFSKPIITAQDLEDFFNVRPSVINYYQQSGKPLVEFRLSDKSYDYFKSVGLLTSEVKSVFDLACHRDAYSIDAAYGLNNLELCSILTNTELSDKYNLNLNQNVSKDNLGLKKSEECTNAAYTWIENKKYPGYGWCWHAKPSDSLGCSQSAPLYYTYEEKLLSKEHYCGYEMGKASIKVYGKDISYDLCDIDNSTCSENYECAPKYFQDGVTRVVYKDKNNPDDIDKVSAGETVSVCVPKWEFRDVPKIPYSIDQTDYKALGFQREEDCAEGEKYGQIGDRNYGYCYKGDISPNESECQNGYYFVEGALTCLKNDLPEDIRYIDETLGYYYKASVPQLASTGNLECDEGVLVNSMGYKNDIEAGIITAFWVKSYVTEDSVNSYYQTPICVNERSGAALRANNTQNKSLIQKAEASFTPNPDVLGEQLPLDDAPFEIVGGQLVLKNAGLYDLEMENKDIVAPKISVDAGIEEAKIEFYFDLNENGTKDPMEPTVDAGYLGLNVKSDTTSRTYDINKGWNLLAFPLLVKDNMKAKDIFESFSNANIQLEDLAVYRSGKWLVYSYDNLKGYFGTNFDIAQSEGFFVNAKNAGKYVLSGREYTTGVPIYFNQGWNLVGIAGNQNAYTGTSFLEALKGKEIEANQIIRWGNDSRFHSLVVNNGSVYGESEVKDLIDTEGYFVKVDKGSGVFQP